MRPIFFLHIPKTGGVSIHRYLSELMGGFRFLEQSGERERTLSAILSRFPSAGGHMRMADLIERWDPFVAVFTILRDPVDRFLSHYFFIRSLGQLSHDPIVRRVHTLSFEAAIESQDPLVQHLANLQCWYLSSLPAEAPIEDHCESAIGNLGRLKVIGWLDDVSSALRQVAQVAGAVSYPTIPHLNKTKDRPARPDLSEVQCAQMQELTRFDRRLCLAARTLPVAKVETSGRPLPYAALGLVPVRGGGSRQAVIDKVSVHHVGRLQPGDRFVIEVQWHAANDATSVVIGYAIRDFVGQLVDGTNSEYFGGRIQPTANSPQRTYFNLRAGFSSGSFSVDVGLHAPDSSLRGLYHYWASAAAFTVFPLSSRYHEGYAETDAHLESPCDSTPLVPGVPGDIRLWVSCPITSVGAGIEFTVPVELLNGRRRALTTHGEHAVNLSYRWMNDESEEIVVFDGRRTPIFPSQFGRTIRSWMLNVVAPAKPGRYRLQPRLVQEGIRWIEPPELYVDREPVVLVL